MQKNDLALSTGERGGRFEADIAAADDHNPAGMRQLGPDRVDIRPGADRKNAFKVLAGTGEAPRPPAGRPDELSIGEPFSVGCAHRFLIRENLLHAPTQKGRDLPLLPKLLRTNENALEGFCSGQVILGQRRAVVRRIRLGTEKTDRAAKSKLSQDDRALGAGMPGADDQNVEPRWKRPGHHESRRRRRARKTLSPFAACRSSGRG